MKGVDYMADTSIFEIDDIQVDMKNYTKLRCKSALNDSVIFKFLVYNSNSPVNLDDYHIELRARLPKSGQIYSEVDNITKSGNLLTIVCELFGLDIAELDLALTTCNIVTRGETIQRSTTLQESQSTRDAMAKARKLFVR